MSKSQAGDSKSARHARQDKLSHRDWLLLPLLSLLTIALIVGSTELIARRMFSESKPFIPSCMGPNDDSIGAWAIPNSACSDKKRESEWVEYKFNSCGHRAGMECGPKSPGTYRIVMAGSSYAMGHLMQQEKTFAALLPVDLSRRTGRKIELYNEGMVTVHPHALAMRFNEVIEAKPDMILWIVTPFDVGIELPNHARWIPPDTEKLGFLAKAKYRMKVALAGKSTYDALLDLWGQGVHQFSISAPGTLLQHLLYANRSQYVKSYLMGGDETGFLHTQLSTQWQSRLDNFDSDTLKIMGQANAAKIPLVAVLVPNRAQASMIAMGEWPQGIDPYKLSDELRHIITRHGGIFIDVLPSYRSIPDPEQLYFVVDSHPNAKGHAVISGILARELTSHTVPALRIAAQQQVEKAAGR